MKKQAYGRTRIKPNKTHKKINRQNQVHHKSELDNPCKNKTQTEAFILESF